MTMLVPTRGERNNNPGNINQGGGWLGELGPEIVPPGSRYQPRFARFDTPVNGLRAIGKQLLGYQETHGLRTIRAMIGRWAPPSDGNDTDAYVTSVCGHVGVEPDEAIDLTDPEMLGRMIYGVVHQENGRVLYGADILAAACAAALHR